MKTEHNEEPTRRQRAMARGAIILSLAMMSTLTVVALATPSRHAQYDMQAAKNRLKVISNAIQLYRQEYGYKPVEVRKCAADAGLPPSGLEIMDPNNNVDKPWHLALSQMQVPHPVKLFDNAVNHYLLVWPVPDHAIEGLDAMYRVRGEEMPIVADVNMNTSESISANGRIRALVLRLNGQIDEVTLDWSEDFPHNFLVK